MSGWIKLYRQLTNWEWYTDVPVKTLFIHCILKANRKLDKWQGITIERGKFVSSYEKLALETGLTTQQVRTALNKLKSTGEITHQTTSRYSIISIKNYVSFQEVNTPSNKQITNEQQTNNKQITTNKNIEKEKNIKKERNIINLSLVQNNKISNEEREILKKYAKKQGAKNIRAYVNTLIRNGDYIGILKELKQKQKENTPPPISEALKKIKDKLSACYFIGVYGDYTNENQPPEVQHVIKKYGFRDYNDAVEYSYKIKRGANQ